MPNQTPQEILAQLPVSVQEILAASYKKAELKLPPWVWKAVVGVGTPMCLAAYAWLQSIVCPGWVP